MDFLVGNGSVLLYFANDGGIYRALDGYGGLTTGTCGLTNQFGGLQGGGGGGNGSPGTPPGTYSITITANLRLRNSHEPKPDIADCHFLKL